MKRHARGFTLIELMVVVAVVALVLTLAAPSFRDYILLQRLKGTNAQLVTDLQFARSEAVSRNELLHVRVQSNTARTCYVIFTATNNATCDCTRDAGERCTGGTTTEVRTVQVPTSLGVRISATGNPSDRFAFDPRTGGLVFPAVDVRGATPSGYTIEASIDDARLVRNVIGLTGRARICSPGARVQEPACE